MRGLLVVVLLFGVAACGADYETMKAEGNRIASATGVELKRSVLPGQAEPALAAFDSVGWPERGPDATEDTCEIREYDIGKTQLTEWRINCVWSTSRYYGAAALPDLRAIHDRLTAEGWSLVGPASIGTDYTRTTGGQVWGLQVRTGRRDQTPPWSLTPSNAYDSGHARQVDTEIDHGQVLWDLTGRHRFIVRLSLHTPYLNEVMD